MNGKRKEKPKLANKFITKTIKKNFSTKKIFMKSELISTQEEKRKERRASKIIIPNSVNGDPAMIICISSSRGDKEKLYDEKAYRIEAKKHMDNEEQNGTFRYSSDRGQKTFFGWETGFIDLS